MGGWQGKGQGAVEGGLEGRDRQGGGKMEKQAVRQAGTGRQAGWVAVAEGGGSGEPVIPTCLSGHVILPALLPTSIYLCLLKSEACCVCVYVIF